MIVVIDTSAAAEIVMQREHAREYAGHIEDADWVIAPTLYISEINNVFWKYHRFEDMPILDCESYIRNAVEIPDEYISEKELYMEAFALGCNARMPVYDMFFLVLARRHNAWLLTLDRKLKETAAKHSIRMF